MEEANKGMRQYLLLMMALFGLGFLMPAPVHAEQAMLMPGQKDWPFVPGEKFKDYEIMSLTAMLNLYWKAGVLKLDDDKAIEEYIAVTSCNVYREKYQDDFAWPEMIKTTREYLRQYSPRFATKIMVIQPIALGRYLPDKKIFQVSDDTQYHNVRRLFIADYSADRIPCPGTSVGMPKSAPLRAVITLPSGFSLKKIPMTEDYARQIIAYIDGRLKSTDIGLSRRDRFAYVRFYFTIKGFDAIDSGNSPTSFFSESAVNFSGNLDGFEIFADIEGLVPLFQLESYQENGEDNSSDTDLQDLKR